MVEPQNGEPQNDEPQNDELSPSRMPGGQANTAELVGAAYSVIAPLQAKNAGQECRPGMQARNARRLGASHHRRLLAPAITAPGFGYQSKVWLALI